MPHAGLKLIPGVDQNRTPALNETAISQTNLIRFMPDRQGLGLPQKLGGWTRFFPNRVSTSVRALHAWADTNDISHLAIGSEDSLTVLTNGVLYQISPQTYAVDVAPNVFTTNGSAVVLVTDTGASITSYDSVYIETHIAVDGVVLYGFYPAQAVSVNQYDIVSQNIIGNPVLATGTTPTDLFTGMVVTAASVAAGVATVSFTGNFLAPVGCYVMISGVTPTDYNGLHLVSASAAGATSTVSFAIGTAPGAGTGGTVKYVPIPVFSVTNGAPAVTVALNGHGYQVGSTYPLLVPVTLGGITLAAGNYLVQSVQSANVFVITAAAAATSTATVIINGGLARYTYYVGQVAIGPAVGYGAGGYGAGGYGTGVSFAGGRAFVVTTATGSGSHATLHFASPLVAIAPGSQIAVSGVSIAGYNGTWVVTSSTTTSVTFKNTTVTPGSGGSILVNSWGFGGATDWSLDNWGGYLISNPTGGGIYYWSSEAGSDRVTVVPNAPFVSEGAFVAMPERQIVAYGTTSNGVQDPLLIRWSDVGNFSNWVGTVVNQAGSYRIPKGSKVVGAIQGPQQGLVWTDIAMWAMQYINLPYIYSFNEIGTGCGLIGKKAVSAMSGTVYWMSQSQFFKLDGNGVQVINCPIWDVIFQDIDTDNLDHIRCAPNSRFNEVAWYYPIIGSDGEPRRYVKYNTVLDQWDFGSLTRTAWVDQSVFGPPIGANQNAVLMQHETSTDADGKAMNSFIQTGYFALSDGDVQTFVDQVWPDMKWGYYGGDQGADVSITFYVVDYPGQTPRVYGPFTVTQATTYVTPRLRGRLVSIKVSSSDIGSFWRLGNIRYRFQQDGKF